jgi:hypothetical protein
MQNELMTKVDVLGSLLAQIADLTSQADQIKDELKDEATKVDASNVSVGAMFKATIVASDRKVVDYKALCAALKITSDQIAEYTKVTAVFSVKVTAK